MTHKEKCLVNIRCKAINEIIGAKIKELRLVSGLTHKKIAGKVGVTSQQFYKYEHGINQISIGRLMVLCEAIGMNIMDVIPATKVLDNSDTESFVFSRKAGKVFAQIKSKSSQQAALDLLKDIVKLSNKS